MRKLMMEVINITMDEIVKKYLKKTSEEEEKEEILDITIEEIIERYLKKPERKQKKKKEIRCYYCGKERHIEENCWKKKKDKNKENGMKGKCYKCGQRGHFVNK